MSQRIELSALLAIDQATTSGVAMGALVDGRLKRVSFGVAKTAQHRREHLYAAIALAGGMHKLGVVLEDHTGIPLTAYIDGEEVKRGPKQIRGMHAQYGRWLEQLDLIGHPEAQRFETRMDEWRRAVLGKQFAHCDRNTAKAEAVKWSQARFRVQASHDEAEALCILAWAAQTLPSRLAAQRLQGDLLGGYQR